MDRKMRLLDLSVLSGIHLQTIHLMECKGKVNMRTCTLDSLCRALLTEPSVMMGYRAPELPGYDLSLRPKRVRLLAEDS